MELKEVAVQSISPTAIKATNVRKDSADIVKLQASIKAHGMIAPIVIAPLTDAEKAKTTEENIEYGIIDGHCRYAAYVAIHGQESSIPAAMMTTEERSKANTGKQSLMANIIRTDMSDNDIADAVHALYKYYEDEHGRGSYRGLAEETGLSKSKIGRLIANYNARHGGGEETKSKRNPYMDKAYITYDKDAQRILMDKVQDDMHMDIINSISVIDTTDAAGIDAILDNIQRYRAILSQAASAIQKYKKDNEKTSNAVAENQTDEQ